MILVIGGTGQVGSEVTRQLLAMNAEVRVLTRDVAKASSAKEAGAEVVVGDLADPGSLAAPLEGVRRVFLVTDATPAQLQNETGALDAIHAAGVELLVKLSVLGAQAGAPVRFADVQGRLEAAIAERGIPATLLRPNGFMQNDLAWAGSIQAQSTVYSPEADARVSVIDVRDIAAVAVVALTRDGHAGETYELTGPEALSFREQAERIGAVIGKDLEVVSMTPADARAPMVGAGVPEYVADGLVELYTHVYAPGYGEGVADGVQRATGSPPRSFDTFVRDHAAAFTGS